MKIGIPKALLYYYYYPFWRTLFQCLGCETVVSDDTNKTIIGEGSGASVSELCVPIKIFNGHIKNLLKKDVDFILVPRFYSMGNEWYCPKFLGITEISEYSVPGLFEKMLPIDITAKNDRIDYFKDYLPLCDKLGVTQRRLKTAIGEAVKTHLKFRNICAEGYTAPEAFDILDGKPLPKQPDAEITIALAGYVYNIYDNLISMNAVKLLREMGARVLTFDMFTEQSLKPDRRHGKPPYWVFSRKILNFARQTAQNPQTDGLIHLTAFGCGPDSVIGSMIETVCEDSGVPFMTLRVDEHTGDSHIRTRLEAFIDMIKIKNNKVKSV